MSRLTLDTPAQVFFYEHDHYYLSNFSAFRLVWRGLSFDTSEAAYQWSKFDYDPGEVKEDKMRFSCAAVIRSSILRASSAHEAFKIAERNLTLVRPDWSTMKIEVMVGIIRAKVDQHEYVRQKLLKTGDRVLIENSWRDSFWGWGEDRQGENVLGKLWMRIREEIRR